MADDEDIQSLLTAEGLDTPDAQKRGRQLLEEASLTRPGKTRISTEKLPKIREVLGKLQPMCSACQETGLVNQNGSSAEVVLVSPFKCPLCRNTDAQREIHLLVECMTQRRLSRLVVVGGTPTQHTQLRDLLTGSPINIRCVDGTSNSHRTKQARNNLEWAQVCAIWAPTPLDHKVSRLYSADGDAALRVMVDKRGLSSLLQSIRSHLAKRSR